MKVAIYGDHKSAEGAEGYGETPVPPRPPRLCGYFAGPGGAYFTLTLNQASRTACVCGLVAPKRSDAAWIVAWRACR